MNDQINPFLYGRPLQSAEVLVGRDAEIEELLGCVRSGQAVTMYGPRRYGKTSLSRAVEEKAREEFGIEGIYVDLWGASSVSDIVGVLGQAYARVSGAFRMRRFLADLLGRLGFAVSFEGTTVGVSYEARGQERREREALMELLRVPQRMSSRSSSGRVLLILDEFGEVLNVPGEPDALMRSAFQDSPEVSFLFMGSKRSLMDGLFSDRRRPFYNFGRRMELGRLPYEDLGGFIEERFESAGKGISAEAADVLLGLSGGHPYRAQQIASHSFRLCEDEADEETVYAAKDAALEEAEPEFRAILDTMERPRRAVLIALCKEPTSELYSRPYMQRHGIKGSGSLKSALDSLIASGEVEEMRGDSPPRPTDPLLALWVRERMDTG